MHVAVSPDLWARFRSALSPDLCLQREVGLGKLKPARFSPCGSHALLRTPPPLPWLLHRYFIVRRLQTLVLILGPQAQVGSFDWSLAVVYGSALPSPQQTSPPCSAEIYSCVGAIWSARTRLVRGLAGLWRAPSAPLHQPLRQCPVRLRFLEGDFHGPWALFSAPHLLCHFCITTYVDHVPGFQNKIADGLSRSASPSELGLHASDEVGVLTLAGFPLRVLLSRLRVLSLAVYPAKSFPSAGRAASRSAGRPNTDP